MTVILFTSINKHGVRFLPFASRYHERWKSAYLYHTELIMMSCELHSFYLSIWSYFVMNLKRQEKRKINFF